MAGMLLPNNQFQALSALNWGPLLVVVAVLGITSCADENIAARVHVGRMQDFPVGSVTHLQLATSFEDPDPPAIGSETPGVVTQPVSAIISPVPIFIVHDASVDLLALYNRDPHLGCRVEWVEARQRFENPCHGEIYSLTGDCTFGPCPRGLDRFKIVVTEEGELYVDVGEFHTGPTKP